MRRFLDDRSHSPWLGNIDGMTTCRLGDGCTGTLGHGALGGRRDHPVVGGDQVPTGLQAPSGLGDSALKCSPPPTGPGSQP